MKIQISGKTRLIALIGSPIAHSKSPAMQNAAFQALGLDLVYIAFDIGLDRAQDAIASLRTLNVRGANVTMPLKKAVVQYLDKLSPAAEMTGAVNTIVNDDGCLTGHITDGEGYMTSLADAGVDHVGRKLTIIGAGGASAAVAIQAALDGVRAISIFNRRDEFFENGLKTTAILRDRLRCDATMNDIADLDRLRTEIASSDILINATPIGMAGTTESSLFPDDSYFRPGLVVSDLIYVPADTYLLKRARQAGCRTVSGIGMQLFQGVKAFRLWTGMDMPIDVARNALFGRQDNDE